MHDVTKSIIRGPVPLRPSHDVALIFPDSQMFCRTTCLNILWDVTQRCNFNCAHCSAPQFAVSLDEELKPRQVPRVIRHLQGNWNLALTFCGGEPLLKPAFMSLARECRTAFPSARLTTFTNGSLLQYMGEQLLDLSVDVLVSLDGSTPAENDAVRGFGTFDVTVDNLVWFAKRVYRQSQPISLGVSYTLTSRSGDPTRLLSFLSSLGVSRLQIAPLQLNGRASHRSDLLPTVDQIADFAERMLLARQSSSIEIRMDFLRPLFVEYVERRTGCTLAPHYHGCRAVTSEVIIRADGSVVPCRGIYPHSPISREIRLQPLSLLDTPLDTILCSEAFQRVCKLKNPGAYPLYFPCRICAFAGNYCDPCWIEQFLGSTTEKLLCAYAARRQR